MRIEMRRIIAVYDFLSQLRYHVAKMGEYDSMSQMLSVNEVAEIMGVHRRTVERMIAAGEIDAIRVGRAWRIAPQNVNAVAGAAVVNDTQPAKEAARAVALACLAESLAVLRAYCDRTGKNIQDLTVADLQRMV